MIGLNGQTDLSRKQIINDITFYELLIDNYHPNPYLFKDSTSFKQSLNELKTSEINDTPELFYELIKVNNSLRDGHLYLQLPDDITEVSMIGNDFVPFSVKIIDFKIFINKSLDTTLSRWDLVTSINGVSSADLLYEMLPLLPVDGYAINRKYKSLEMYFPFLFHWLYPGQDSFKVEIIPSRGRSVKVSKAVKAISGRIASAKLLEGYLNSWNLEYKNEVGYLSIPSFSNHMIPKDLEFSNWIKEQFNSLEKASVKNLVVDLRGNEGGSVDNMITLLKYLKNQPFELYDYLQVNPNLTFDTLGFLLKEDIKKLTKQSEQNSERVVLKKKDLLKTYKPSKKRFDGGVVILVDGNTFSSASHAVSLLKDQNNVFVIGEETGGSQGFSNAGYKLNVELPNSKIKVSVPLVHGVYQKDKNLSKGALPNQTCAPDVLSFVRFNDPCLLMAFEYIELLKRKNNVKEER